MFRLRYYQNDARDAARAAFDSYRSTAIVLPTATGKTEIYLSMAVEERGRVLVVVHRDYLITSPVERLARAGFTDVAVEKADRRSEIAFKDARAKIVFASVQSIGPEHQLARLRTFDPKDFSLLVIDEGHRAVSPIYRRVKEYFEAGNPRLKTLILTATPKRKDGLALGNVCDSVAYEMSPGQAALEGWIVPPRFFVRDVPYLKFDKVTLRGADLNPDQIAELLTEEESLHKLCASLVEDQGPTIVFCPKVVVAEVYAAVIGQRYRRDKAVAVHQHSTDDEMERATKGLADGTIDFVFNVDKLCLDSETEILTASGWVGMDSMTPHHEVANWNTDGTIFFERPKDIVRRRRFVGERMVTLSGCRPRMDIRVTEMHRMMCRLSGKSPWKLEHAAAIADKVREFPVCGNAPPAHIEAAQAEITVTGAKVRQTAYVLRRSGMAAAAARAEATTRLTDRASLRRKSPAELTSDECELIGFWLGDGSVNRPKRGGLEYTLCQSAVCPAIVARIDALLASCGIDSIRRQRHTKRDRPYFVWSLPRGTGSGPQARRGVYAIESFLNKSGVPAFWGLDRNQFIALLRGLWMADGTTHRDETAPCGSYSIGGSNRNLLDLLQAVGVCRGLSVGIRQTVSRESHHGPFFILTVFDRVVHRIGKHPMRIETEAWKDEPIWCVTSTTGNIVTRRRGTVMVTGNTEGYDVPRVVRVAWAAPTASLVRWTQGCGRGFRPDAAVARHLLGNREDAPTRRLLIEQSAKPYCSIVTYYPSNCQHQICTAVDLLGGLMLPPEIKGVAEMVQEETSRQAGGSNTEEDIETARAFVDFRSLLDERRQALKAKATVVDAEYDGMGGQRQRLRDGVGPDPADTNLAASASWGKGEPATERQVKWLLWKGAAPQAARSCSKWQASVVRDLFELGVHLETALRYGKRQALKVRDELRSSLT